MKRHHASRTSPGPIARSVAPSVIVCAGTVFLAAISGFTWNTPAQAATRGETDLLLGDVYAVSSTSNHLVYLDPYGGLGLVGLSDPANPAIVGRLRLRGQPVELHLAGDRALVLLNDRGGSSGRDSEAGDPRDLHGAIVLVDLSDPSAPAMVDRAYVPGYIQTSRLTRGGDTTVLYVAAVSHRLAWQTGYERDPRTDGKTFLSSFEVSGGSLEPRGELTLEGLLGDVEGTPEILMVARNDWSVSDGFSRVSLIDLRPLDGEMIEGNEVRTPGRVRNRSNLDLHEGVLRVVSGRVRGATRWNHLQTFDARDPHRVVPIDHVEFGHDESLFATAIVDNGVYVSTAEGGVRESRGTGQSALFRSFSIDDEGLLIERSEFEWATIDNLVVPVLNETRLIGVGTTHEVARTLSVSLYDATDSSDPNPLLARAGVWVDNSWSVASFGERTVSVLEDVVRVPGAGDEVETGLVLLPSWGGDLVRLPRSSVQLFTFSTDSLTRRGVMEQRSRVRRSFLVGEALAANLSDVELQLFDISDVDRPRRVGRVLLLP